VKVKSPSSWHSTAWRFCGWCHQHHF